MASGASAPDRRTGRKIRPWHIALLVPVFLLLVPERAREAHGTTPRNAADMPVDAELSVMTFNIEGLPFPARYGRDAALKQIGSRLAAMRGDRRQPRIVLLQESFSADARKVARRAGYAYIVDGPAPGLAQPWAPTAGDAAFTASARSWMGEGGQKLLGSGLQILSDYPVVGVRRLAFPAFACAGFDCLANKGALLVFVTVPGRGEPIAIVATHLNSRTAAGVSVDRSNHAFRRQVDLLSQFLRENVPAATPLIVGGDFNVGEDGERQAYLLSKMRQWPHLSGSAINGALDLCAIEQGCASTMSADARLIRSSRKDMQFVSPAVDGLLTPQRASVPFGREPDGSTLSDHMGYTVYYRWRTPAPAATG